MTRICSKCAKDKPDSDFYKHPSIKPDGIRKYCGDCRKDYRKKAHLEHPDRNRQIAKAWAAKNRAKLNEQARRNRALNKERFKAYAIKSQFGMSPEEWQDIFSRQNGKCAICLLPETSKLRGEVKTLSVDHHHASGKNRGLLCSRCNTGIGKLRDNPEILRSAADYIEKHK